MGIGRSAILPTAKIPAFGKGLVSQQGSSGSYWTQQSSAFFIAAGITDATQKSAINTFVKKLIAINAIDSSFVDFVTPANSSLKACYIFVGGNATAHKFNLINPADSDVAFRITFAGTIVHDEKGIKPNGTTGYGDTHLSPKTSLSLSNHGMDVFINLGTQNAVNSCELGAGATANQKLVIANQFEGDAYSRFYDKGAVESFIESGSQFYFNALGLVQLERVDDGNGNTKYYKNGILVKVNSSDAAGDLPTETLTIGKWNGIGWFTDKIISYVGVRSKTISPTANALYMAAIYELQNNLSRLPIKNIMFEGHSMMASIVPYDVMLNTETVYAERLFNEINSAIGGSHVSDMVTRYSTAVTPYKRLTPFSNIFIVWAGINDLRIPMTGANIWAALLSYVNQAITDGWTPILLTTTRVTVAGWPEVSETERQALNTLIKTSCPTGCSFINLDLNQEFTDPSNVTYFSDGLHMTAAGYMIVANHIGSKFADNLMALDANVEDATPTSISFTFDSVLDTSSVPATTDFSIAGKTISNVVVSGNAVTLTVTVAFAYGDFPVVAYTKPVSNYLKALTGSKSVATFTYAVMNNILIVPSVSSAQVTDTNKDKVVLTFTAPLDNTSVPATTDFALAGKTINTVAIVGSTVTLTVSVAYVNGNVITCNYTSGTNKLKGTNGKNVVSFSGQSVTNNIADPAIAIINDGNTVGWYLADTLSTITKDGSNLVAQWNDYLGSGHNLAQGTAGQKPVWSSSGIQFDGVDDTMTASFTINQPTFLYLVLKEIWVSGGRLFDGGSPNGGYVRMVAGPSLGLNAGSYITYNYDMPDNTFVVMRALFNGASSKLIINAGTPATGNCGANNMGGLTLASYGTGQYGNVQIKEIIMRKVSDSSGNETAIYNYLKNKYGL